MRIPPLVALVCLANQCIGFSTLPTTKQQQRFPHNHLNLATNNDDNLNDKDKQSTDESNSYSWAELQADPELSKLERNSSIQRKNAMLLPQRISQATSIVAWSFVIGGIVLNSLGYAWVRDPSGGIGIGTLEWVESNVHMWIVCVQEPNCLC